MVRSHLAVAGISVTILGLASLMNCGGSTTNATGTSSAGGSSSKSTTTTTATTGSATGGSTSSGSFTPVEPPPAPAMTAPNGPTNVTMAISELFLGDTDPDGTPDETNGWEHYGYNIDGVNPSDLSKFCKPVDGAAPGMLHMEGPGGIENSFGHNILPIVLGIASDASTKINDSITAGDFTIMLDMGSLGTGMSYNPINTQLFGGSNCNCMPNFTGMMGTSGFTEWPVTPSLLKDGMTIAGGSLVQFPTSYLTKNTWVSGSKGMLTLALSISGFTLSLNIAEAVITMNLNSGHTLATGGIISGVLPTAQLTQQIQEVAGSFDQSLCSGQTIQSILAEIAAASDIMADGTQDPTQNCTGISIGLGFDSALIQNPTQVAPPAPCAVNPCDMDASCPDGG